MFTDKFKKGETTDFDECNNFYVKPKPPIFVDVLDHLHKKADFEGGGE